jgi:hypothetical protein
MPCTSIFATPCGPRDTGMAGQGPWQARAFLSFPDAERTAYRDKLAEVIGVVIGDKQDRAQVGLLSFAGRHSREQIHGVSSDEPLQLLAIGFEIVDAFGPCRRVRRRGLRPVIARPLQGVDVPWVDAEVEQILLRQAHVLEQLPEGVLEAWRLRPALTHRDTVDGLFKADVGFVPVKETRQLRPQRISLLFHGVTLTPEFRSNEPPSSAARASRSARTAARLSRAHETFPPAAHILVDGAQVVSSVDEHHLDRLE